MAKKKAPEEMSRKEVDFVVDPLSDEDFEAVSGGLRANCVEGLGDDCGCDEA